MNARSLVGVYNLFINCPKIKDFGLAILAMGAILVVLPEKAF